ncbi:MAG TPA: Rieske (2Fe-2S) protein [Acidimicrobiales bacterium]|nr:Rieske (2Fe-2S) protein [Acidimicrobiales bacterium]
MAERVQLGTVDELHKKGCLTGKVGTQPVCVFWSDGAAYAVDDRCPHMGFPLHRGTVEGGLLTCHWHHARFDLSSGGTLDPFADDVGAYPVEVDDDGVWVLVEAPADRVPHLLQRLEEGLEQGLSLVMAKAVLGLFDALGPAEAIPAILGAGTAFGVRYREAGWGSGLTVLTAMANVLDALDPADRPLALVHGLVFVARDTTGAPRFPLEPLSADLPADRLGAWYRRFVGTRSGDAAERTLATATRATFSASALAGIMGAAVTDHVFVDGGHTVDFTNKAFEMVEHLGPDRAVEILPTLAQQTAGASRSEESSEWRHPHPLADLLARAEADLPGRMTAVIGRSFGGDEDVDALAWAVLGDEPAEILAALDRAVDAGATAEELARAVAYAAALRITRFHIQNDHRDWDVVHHGFTSANAVHQLVCRNGSPEVVRGVYQGALKVFLDRFLNLPPARSPATHQAAATKPDLADLQACWDRQGMVDEAGAIVYGWLINGGSKAEVLAVLGSALLAEDAGFHWFQTYEAAARQLAAWPDGSEQQALILAGTARWLAAHTPTRRELPQVVRIATRLRRGDPLYELAEG